MKDKIADNQLSGRQHCIMLTWVKLYEHDSVWLQCLLTSVGLKGVFRYQHRTCKKKKKKIPCSSTGYEELEGTDKSVVVFCFD